MNLDNFSNRQLAGQRLMVGFDGTGLDDDLKFLIGTLKVGGLILFARNLAAPDQITRLCRDAQRFARENRQPPLLIAIDQEGGRVARLKPPFTQFPGNPHMNGTADADHFARITAAELTGLGINMNMAPVLDIAPKEMNSIMAGRAFGHDPAQVAEMGGAVINGLQQRGIMAVAKHFPGIGRTTLDSHLELPTLDTDMAEMASFDLIPFETAIRQNAAGIMLSHIRYRGIDSRWPASLSVPLAKELLRDRMGYQGVVITDDLDMGAVKNHFDIPEVIGRIIAAHIDIALICHKGPDIQRAFEEMLRGCEGDRREAAVASVARIMRLKKRFLLS